MGQRIVISADAQRDIACAAAWYEHQRAHLGKGFIADTDAVI